MPPTRILIVDDVQQVREDLRSLLQWLGGDVEVAGEASNGLSAVSQAQALHPDVVLMDLEMPLLDGYEATRRIKTLYPDCRVVALSIHSYAAARQKAAQAGVDCFVEKGAALETLLQAILGPEGGNNG